MTRRCAVCGKELRHIGHWSDYLYKTKFKGVVTYFCGYGCMNRGEEFREDILIDQKPLARARATYGNKNQILVSMEELNELAAALAKYPRYDDGELAIEKTRDKVLDEVADVYVILEHVKSIYRLRNGEINKRIALKQDRLTRWLDESTSMYQTTVDRSV